MAIALQDSVAGTGGSGPAAVAYVSAAALGDLLFAWAIVNGNPTTPTISDTGSGTAWTPIGTQVSDSTNSVFMNLYYKVADAVATPTVTWSAANNPFGNLYIARYNGFTGTPTVDAGMTSQPSGSATTSVAISVTTNFNNELVIITFRSGVGLNGSEPGAWLQIITGNDRGHYNVQATSGSSIPWNRTLASATWWDAMVVGIYDQTATTPLMGQICL